MMCVWGYGSIAPLFLKFDARWRWLAACLASPFFHLRKISPLSTGHEIEWDKEPIWTLRRRGNPFLALGIQPLL
jgi:hypothetical protein